MRISGHGVVRMLVAAAIMAAGAGGAHAESLKWLGVHGAYFSQYEDVSLGINARQDVGNDFSVGFIVDYIFRGDTRTTWVGGFDLQWEKELPRQHLAAWVGGGGGVFRDDLKQPNLKPDYQAFAVAFVGVGLDGHHVMPYAEFRLMTHEVVHGVVYAGLRF
jgi:hypothetical protein